MHLSLYWNHEKFKLNLSYAALLLFRRAFCFLYCFSIEPVSESIGAWFLINVSEMRSLPPVLSC